MINFLLQYPFLYRFYQKLVRGKYDEYDFFQFIFKKLSKKKKIRVLDLCCADSFILDYINKFIDDYIGIDFNKYCIASSKVKWKKYKFKQLDLTKEKTFKKLVKFSPNFILVHGAFHHLNDETVKKIVKFIKYYFPKSIFISVDPVRDNNKIINKIMIELDRGKFIRTKKDFSRLIKQFKSIITDNFYTMSFKYIFYYRNLHLPKIYKEWQKLKYL